MDSRLPLLAGIAVLALWLEGLTWFQPLPLVDEAGHQLPVERIARGRMGAHLLPGHATGTPLTSGALQPPHWGQPVDIPGC